MRRWTVAVGLAAVVAFAGPVRAQGFGVVLGAAAGPSLAERGPDGAGAGFVIEPEWRFRDGAGVALGFRYLVYPGVPNHGLLFLELNGLAGTGSTRPLFGVRAGIFAGGDEGGDDPFLGVQAGPVLGFEHPVSSDAAIRVTGSLLATKAVYRDFRWVGGLEAGIRIHH